MIKDNPWFVPRSYHDEEIKRIKDASDSAIADLEREIRDMRHNLSDVMQGLYKIRIERHNGPPSGDSWRLCLDLNSMMMRDALERGNSFRALEYMGEVIKHEFIQHMTSMNIQRPEPRRRVCDDLVYSPRPRRPGLSTY